MWQSIQALAFIGAFAERHEGAVPVFVRGSATLSRASLFFEERKRFTTENCGKCSAWHDATSVRIVDDIGTIMVRHACGEAQAMLGFKPFRPQYET